MQHRESARQLPRKPNSRHLNNNFGAYKFFHPVDYWVCKVDSQEHDSRQAINQFSRFSSPQGWKGLVLSNAVRHDWISFNFILNLISFHVLHLLVYKNSLPKSSLSLKLQNLRKIRILRQIIYSTYTNGYERQKIKLKENDSTITLSVSYSSTGWHYAQ